MHLILSYVRQTAYPDRSLRRIFGTLPRFHGFPRRPASLDRGGPA